MARILVVDDSRITRRLLASALKDAGHEVTQACDGEEGLETFKSSEFDMVFSDLLMPKMDGFEMTAGILEINPQMPVVVATADIQESSLERCEEIGVRRLINKPFKPADITDAVDEFLVSAGGSV